MIRTLTATAALLAAAPLVAQMSTPKSTMPRSTMPAGAMAKPMAMMPTTPAEYVKMAGASDLFEKQSSRLVLRTTRNPRVKAFATKMLADHGKSTGEVTAAAVKSGLRPGTPMLSAMQQGMVNKLLAAKGTARDRLYLQQQMPAHEMALQVHQYHASNGTKPLLKAAAAKIAPVVQTHIDMLKAMPGA